MPCTGEFCGDPFLRVHAVGGRFAVGQYPSSPSETLHHCMGRRGVAEDDPHGISSMHRRGEIRCGLAGGCGKDSAARRYREIPWSLHHDACTQRVSRPGWVEELHRTLRPARIRLCRGPPIGRIEFQRACRKGIVDARNGTGSSAGTQQHTRECEPVKRGTLVRIHREVQSRGCQTVHDLAVHNLVAVGPSRDEREEIRVDCGDDPVSVAVIHGGLHGCLCQTVRPVCLERKVRIAELYLKNIQRVRSGKHKMFQNHTRCDRALGVQAGLRIGTHMECNDKKHRKHTAAECQVSHGLVSGGRMISFLWEEPGFAFTST